MKKLLYIFIIIPSFLFSQVGINTTTPGAILDIASTKHGVLFPRVSLEFLTQEAPVLNPKGAGLENGTLVYNTATINNVSPGYYYWEVNQWIRFATNNQYMKFTTVSLPNPSSENNNCDFLLQTTNYTANVFRLLHNGAELSGVKEGTHGRVIYLYNGDETEDLKLLSEGGSSSSNVNKFSLQNDVILKPGNSIVIFYDDLYLHRWIVVRSDN
ncbi:MAG: hypothetical protein COA88_07645 [Kordia sp.]|nr:MAG: hypothetical protein COA88_07645 [Kordia sp.]